ncbi:CDP-glycerol glycerophosphotransferase family protein [Leucobacter triazinivorans]|uniref:Glycosyltransferase n=1 Tax=Leucobacter triazinivorans TaxID=1784719 RepID=A0A4P6KFD5_9MICO|nr:CDP-glycerol glycerophosphotransferase family protein [Leucobacter triazinivorans]QBE48648.1 glycosyltransferase [Leucobacter triazinivorans]
MTRQPVVSAHVALARLARRKQDWPKAAEHFARAAEAAANDADLWWQTAKSLEYAGLPGAEVALARAVTGEGANSETWYRHGRVLEQAGRFNEALKAFRASEGAGGNVGHLAFRQARCHEAMGDALNAAVSFRRAAEAGFDPKQCFRELERLQDSAAPRWIRVDLYREGQTCFESDEDWTLTHARLAAQMDFYSEAIDLYAAISEIKPLAENDVLLYARSLELAGQDAHARIVLENALERLFPNKVSIGIGKIFQRAGMWSRARHEYLEQLSGDPHNAELLYRIGLTYDREYKWAEAIGYFERAFEQSPSSAYWAYKCGHAWERLREFEHAIGWYESALLRQGDKSHWWYRLGVCLNQIGESELANQALLRSVRKFDGNDVQPAATVAVQDFRDATRGRWSLNLSDRAERALVDGAQTLQAPSDLISLAQVVHGLEHSGTRQALLRKAAGCGFDLNAEDRTLLACSLTDSGLHDESVQVLLDSRHIRMPDGVELKKHLPADASRRTRLYAEFWNHRPVDHSLVLFESNHGSSAGCHPLALFRQMLGDERFSGKTFVWALKNNVDAPRVVRECSRVRLVIVGSDEYLACLATAGMLVNNVSFPPYFTRKPAQRYLNTWHGTPMKTLGRSMRQGLVEYENLERNFIQATHLLAPNELTKWALLDEHHLNGIYPGSVGMVGSPRLDALVRDGETLRSHIRERLGVDQGDRLVLVAPTWRGGVSDHEFDASTLVEQLEALASIEGVKIVYRAHRLTEQLVRGIELPADSVPADIDTNDLLAAVDHLVTDYSSIQFDFMVTRRPITLYIPDLEEYQRDRGLYLSPSNLPVGVATTITELLDDVRAGGSVERTEYDAAVERYCPYEDGYASARCLDFFLSDGGRGAELNGRKTVVFHASLIPNGIASALLAILTELVATGINVLLIIEPKVLREQPDRAETFRRLPDGVRLISRVGDTVMSPEEFYLRGVVEAGRSDPGPDMLEKYRASWRKEALRVVGDIPIDAAIEWDGYAVLWAGLVSAIGDASTSHLIWQHNQMGDEQQHKYPELSSLFRLYPWFDEVVSVSEQLAEQNEADLGPRGLLPASGVQAVPNALLFDEVLEKSTAAMLPEHEELFGGAGPVVVTVGRLSMEKNQEALIRAWPTVLQRHPRAKLLIIGSGPLQPSLEALVTTLGLDGSVFMLGQLRNPYPVMKRAELFVLPSLHEGQPIVLFEAMALGVPIGASDCPGNLEAMDIGYGAHLGTEPAILGEGINRLLADNRTARGRFDSSAHQRKALRRFQEVVRLA